MSSTNLHRPKSSASTRKALNIHLPSAGTVNTIRTSKSMSNSQQKEVEDPLSESDKKIQDLIKKTTEMQGDVKKNNEFVEEKFTNLRQRINDSLAFLRTTKNQIDNIKFMFQRDMINMDSNQSFGDCLKDSDQSVDQLNSQMEEIQEKLNSLKEKTKQGNDSPTDRTSQDKHFESAVTEAIDTLDNIGKGDYSAKEAK